MSKELNERSSIEDKDSEEELSLTSLKSVRSSFESSKSSGFSKIKPSVGLKSKSKEPPGIQSARSRVDTGSSSGVSVPKSIIEIPRFDHEFLSAQSGLSTTLVGREGFLPEEDDSPEDLLDKDDTE